MVERNDDDDVRTLQAFRALRRHVVQVSSDFGDRLGVRLLALAAARAHGDPALVEVVGATFLEATTLVLSPLSPGQQARREPLPLPADSPESQPTDDEAKDE